MSESFKVPGRKRSIPDGKDGYKTRVTEEAYAALVESCNESTLSLKEMASRAILYAIEHIEYIRD